MLSDHNTDIIIMVLYVHTNTYISPSSSPTTSESLCTCHHICQLQAIQLYYNPETHYYTEYQKLWHQPTLTYPLPNFNTHQFTVQSASKVIPPLPLHYIIRAGILISFHHSNTILYMTLYPKGSRYTDLMPRMEWGPILASLAICGLATGRGEGRDNERMPKLRRQWSCMHVHTHPAPAVAILAIA